LKRIVLIIALVVVTGVAGFFLLKPKPKAASSGKASRARTADEENGEAKPQSARGRGRVSGRVRTRSKADIKAERKLARKEERKRKREAKRRERERRRQLRASRSRRGTRRLRSRSGRRGSKGQLHVVSAIVSLGSDSYALVDGRRVAVGDVIMGRRIVEIQPDRVVVEAFGRRSTVRVGQSVVPLTFSTRRSRR